MAANGRFGSGKVGRLSRPGAQPSGQGF